jgi:hypothetical protein
MFHAFDTGKLLAAPAICAMAAIVAMSMMRIFTACSGQARPGGFRGAPTFQKTIRLPL